MFDDAAGATWAIVGQHYLGMRRHDIERLGGSGKTRGEQKAGDQGEEEMFDRFHFEHPLSPMSWTHPSPAYTRFCPVCTE
jgi:hypothetical protein